ncbi:MAG: type II secretion system F family protein [Candidatus Aenigmarchaeota archaeon]|nr:type II secretion system F family protein [Candidatus Aenigmarchaeota archaeon]
MKFDFKKISYQHIPLIVAALIIFFGIIVFWGNAALIGNFILFGSVVGTIPYIMISYLRYQKIKAIEDQIPGFLLDLSEAQKTGMTLPSALKTISKKDYGVLTKEIKKMNNQISWGIPVKEVFERFSKRMKDSIIIKRIVRIIVESYESGGDIGKTMESTANDIIELKEIEKERKAMMIQHITVMYVIYFIFIGIIIGLSKTIVPMLNISTGGTFGGILIFEDPCVSCIGAKHIFCISCSVFGFVCKMFSLGTGTLCYYHSLFLMMVVIQGIFSGLVAGQISENSVLAGFKHSVIMTASGFGILLILLQTGII